MAMKRLLIISVFCLGLLNINIAFAQYAHSEVVYLKNGSVINGTVIEKVPNKYIKIKISSGTVVTCSWGDVEKIVLNTKSPVSKNDVNTNNNIIKYSDIALGRDNVSQQSSSNTRYYPARRGNNYNIRGYHGFIDAGWIVDCDDDHNDDDCGGDTYSRYEISTTHGYQFNNIIFLGAGLAMNYYPDIDLTGVPVYMNFKVNFAKSKITPYFDLKYGYSLGDIDGDYISLGFGMRFGITSHFAINLRTEYNYIDYNYDDYDDWWFDGINGFAIKLGIEF